MVKFLLKSIIGSSLSQITSFSVGKCELGDSLLIAVELIAARRASRATFVYIPDDRAVVLACAELLSACGHVIVNVSAVDVLLYMRSTRERAVPDGARFFHVNNANVVICASSNQGMQPLSVAQYRMHFYSI
jgi:hypothetical protein